MQKNGLFSFLNTKTMVYLSMLIALYTVLSVFVIYFTPQLRFNFAFIPSAVASIMFGPLAGAITGAFGDFLGWVVTHPDAYNPGLTISGFVTGLIYGVFLYKKELTFKRALFAAITVVSIVELGLNTLWLSIMYGSAYRVLFFERLIKAVLIPLQAPILYSMKFVIKRIKINT